MQTFIDKILSFRYSGIIFSIILFLIGLSIILFPSIAFYILSIGLGLLLLSFGVEGMIRLFLQRSEGLFFFLRFMGCLLLLGGGVGLLFFGTHLAGPVCFGIGLFLIIDASVKLFLLLAHKQVRTRSFWMRLSLSALSFILGLALLLTSSSILLGAIRLLGVALLLQGVHSFVDSILRLYTAKCKKSSDHPPIETSFTDRSNP